MNMIQQIYLNTQTNMILTSDKPAPKPGWLHIGEGHHKKVINWLISLRAAMGDLVETDIETLRESWDRHEM